MLALDLKTAGSTDDDNATASYFVDFQVAADPLEPWTLRIDTRRRGAMTIVEDHANDNDDLIEVRSVTATYRLNDDPITHMPQLEFGQNALTSESDADDPFHDVDPATCPGYILSGVGPATIKLEFTWQMLVRVHGGVLGGDEAAIRMGIQSALADFTAGDYPGAGSRDPEEDGHFVCVTMCSQPAVEVTTVCLSNDAPCTLKAFGTVEGCLGQNYTVMIRWFKDGVQVASAQQSITDCNPQWGPLLAVVSGGGFCAPPYGYIVTVQDDPGPSVVHGPPETGADGSAGSIIASTQGELTETCSAAVPLASPPSIVIVLMLLVVAGAAALVGRSIRVPD